MNSDDFRQQIEEMKAMLEKAQGACPAWKIQISPSLAEKVGATQGSKWLGCVVEIEGECPPHTYYLVEQ